MQSRWNDEDAARHTDPLDLRVYTSRLLGQDPALVLHGGGNTSVKLKEQNLFGDPEDILYIKGSGWDLATIERAGFAPVRLAPAAALARLPRLSDPDMVNALRTQMTRADAPTPSVETILHAIIPQAFVDHTHADAVVTVTNTPDGERRIREIYGDLVVVVPYCMPGFDLARLCAERLARDAGPGTIGMVLMNHGVFSFGDTARESYERMIRLVGMAEDHLRAAGAWDVVPPRKPATCATPRAAIASLRQAISNAAGRPLLLRTDTDAATLAFARHEAVERIARQGPATPDHVIRTKRLPLIGRDVGAYAAAYRAYFERNAPHAAEPKTMLDPAPRVVIDPEFGLGAVGRSAAECGIVADICRHTQDIILRAEALGGWRALPERALFDVEYWDLEQAKLRKGGKGAPFAGEVALVTGAASGIGKACVDSLLARGAAVVGLDLNPAIAGRWSTPAFLGLACDVTDIAALTAALDAGVQRFGGLDMLVLNAGVFPASRKVAELDDAHWRRVFAVNLDANLALLRETHGLLRLAPRRGRVVVIGSKNVPAPGPGAAAYSASKAALNQLARVIALEWGAEGIRVNSLHPNAVFDTGLWTDEVLNARAASYGLTVEDYKTRNVLHAEVTSRDVAELAAEMCGPLFAKTTGTQVPVDGGNERVI